MIKFSRILLLVTILFAACSKGDDSPGGDDGGETPNSFDRGAMLANWADVIIVPAYAAFTEQTNELQLASENFSANPTSESLISLQQSFREAYNGFETVSMFEIGKADELNYRNYLNTYPVNTSSVDSKIETGSYNLDLPSSYTEQGFPALDYLLFGLGSTNEDILEFYISDTNSEAYKKYLVDVASRINNLTSQVNASWQGNYRDTFVNNTSSSSTGSVDRFTNEYVMYFEKILRSGKIGYPAGAFTGTPSPQNVEAFYAEDLSKELYETALNSFYDFYLGNSIVDTGNGSSFSDYLQYLDSMKDDADLDKLIKDQFAVVFSKSETLKSSLKAQVENDNSLMLSNFDELQRLVVLLKVDMMQALSISVDYVDSDGD
ncbi:imelysin family protein [Gramella sp. AN32]|uniref:Imelysin family protein n=1 Tax=Christiangramia antarctica TaxID=2058158 RepID=A0ABW5X4T8_9FLAO|nr:imelysin family protein [Gramella sp. AN32]MCM4157665.1 peptidase M75 superfamily protein [Gramella sp. AN32]